eukprot:CAMPEP_0204547500 /NCGR_PEP_ID=MMETSP0661-20131031/22846_1 /ASSEMBLY_ACC=CAM_ASM_000606 /TAXON_ID=109239 /ORGANISM="Alexandrium margalefi, Strain AMGDE01CS-322" /LENGTH=114 /DNA_ID=CAMNT_0051554367 /DNA_START=232 /DNA_END=577 /DNA_ORIENTATION=+
MGYGHSFAVQNGVVISMIIRSKPGRLYFDRSTTPEPQAQAPGTVPRATVPLGRSGGAHRAPQRTFEEGSESSSCEARLSSPTPHTRQRRLRWGPALQQVCVDSLPTAVAGPLDD